MMTTQIPTQITFRHMTTSAALEERVRELVGRLGKFSPQIIRCRVVIAAPQGHHRHGERFDVRLDISVPGREISVSNNHVKDAAHTDAYLAVRDAFMAARRQLQDYERERRLDVKAHSLPPADADV
jgi:ribosome-associated translation inhibitor RaiA